MKTTKRLLSIAMTLLMLLSMLPEPALAAPAEAAVSSGTAVARTHAPAAAAPVSESEPAVPADSGCACESCTCESCACEDGACACGGCGDGCACTGGSCTDCAKGASCGCAQADPVQIGAPVRGTQTITESSFGIENIKWSRGTDDGTKISPMRLLTEGKKAAVNRVADEGDLVILMEAGDDEHCEGCGKYLPNSPWFCDDCHYCHECILNGDGPYHCADCEGCDVDPCDYCTEHHVNDGGNFVLCKDCACDDGYHCYECDECLGNKDYHDV